MTTIHETIDRYLQIWNQRDPVARRAAVLGVFGEACSYTDPLAAVTGHDGIDRFIAGVQQQFAEVRFVLAGTVDAHHDVARFTWHARAEGREDPSSSTASASSRSSAFSTRSRADRGPARARDAAPRPEPA